MWLCMSKKGWFHLMQEFCCGCYSLEEHERVLLVDLESKNQLCHSCKLFLDLCLLLFALVGHSDGLLLHCADLLLNLSGAW